MVSGAFVEFPPSLTRIMVKVRARCERSVTQDGCAHTADMEPVPVRAGERLWKRGVNCRDFYRITYVWGVLRDYERPLIVLGCRVVGRNA